MSQLKVRKPSDHPLGNSCSFGLTRMLIFFCPLRSDMFLLNFKDGCLCQFDAMSHKKTGSLFFFLF